MRKQFYLLAENIVYRLYLYCIRNQAFSEQEHKQHPQMQFLTQKLYTLLSEKVSPLPCSTESINDRLCARQRGAMAAIAHNAVLTTWDTERVDSQSRSLLFDKLRLEELGKLCIRLWSPGPTTLSSCRLPFLSTL